VEPKDGAEEQGGARLGEPAAGADHVHHVDRGEQLVYGAHHDQGHVHLDHDEPAAERAVRSVADIAVRLYASGGGG